MDILLIRVDASSSYKTVSTCRSKINKLLKIYYLTTHKIMRTKKGFNLRDVCGEKIVVAEGKENIDFSKVISMNETSAFLWEKVKDKNFTVDDLATLLTEEYDVDKETATTDCQSLIRLWNEAGLIDL
jgi:hypothetical protein